MGTHPIFESDFNCLTDIVLMDSSSESSNYDNGTDFSTDSSSRIDEDDSDSSSDEEPEPEWNEDYHAFVNGHGRVILWTDGACKGNHLGPAGDRTSGIGVWVHGKKFWKKRNNKYPDTNQYAELYAIEFALRNARKQGWGNKFEIRTDSKYAFKCLAQKWKLWKGNGWKKTDGTPLKLEMFFKTFL